MLILGCNGKFPSGFEYFIETAEIIMDVEVTIWCSLMFKFLKSASYFQVIIAPTEKYYVWYPVQHTLMKKLLPSTTLLTIPYN